MTNIKRYNLSEKQISGYEALGFLQSIPVLSGSEVQQYRKQIDTTGHALGGAMTRLNGAHLFFHWAWDLCSHPRILDTLEQIIGPNIFIKSSRFFYKHPHSKSFVGWHQDGYTESLTSACEPTIWLALSDATIKNGCLRIIPGSHQQGLIHHDLLPHQDNLTARGTTVRTKSNAAKNIIMPAGQMSLHHPLIVHGSSPNISDEARIGFSATYTTPEFMNDNPDNAQVRGITPIRTPRTRSFEQEIADFRASDHDVYFSPS